MVGLSPLWRAGLATVAAEARLRLPPGLREGDRLEAMLVTANSRRMPLRLVVRV